MVAVVCDEFERVGALEGGATVVGKGSARWWQPKLWSISRW